jgi:GNAT superfamily N-acetyltransferase
MKNKIKLLLATAVSLQANIEIAPANYNDLEALITLDRKVTLEYFLPLYTKIFPNLKNPLAQLEEELEADKKIFRDTIINPASTQKIQVAYNSTTKAIAGFMIVREVNKNEIEIELLLVDKGYRGQKVGYKLVATIFDVFPNAKTCNVFPFQADTTWQFYEKAGFKRIGVGPEDKLNFYGQKYSVFYYHYQQTSTQGLNAKPLQSLR